MNGTIISLIGPILRQIEKLLIALRDMKKINTERTSDIVRLINEIEINLNADNFETKKSIGHLTILYGEILEYYEKTIKEGW